MNIGEAARRTGLSAKTIRYYESVDLVAATRDQNGYRKFTDKEIQQLMFIKRLRNLGFTLADCQTLISAMGNDPTSTQHERVEDAELKALLRQKLQDVNDKLEELISLRSSIKQSIADVKTQTDGSEFIKLLNRNS